MRIYTPSLSSVRHNHFYLQDFKKGFPLGYVKSKEDFIRAVTSTAPSWPDLSRYIGTYRG